MLISPIQNTAVFNLEWTQQRPYITQGFGIENTAPSLLDDYQSFGLLAHNGLDFRAKTGTPLFAPLTGKVTVGDQGSSGYGKYVRVKTSTTEVVLGHLSKVLVTDGAFVHAGDKIAYSGNSGFSTASHLHFGLRFLEAGEIIDYSNGYFGYVDPSPYLITWKGTLSNNTL